MRGRRDGSTSNPGGVPPLNKIAVPFCKQAEVGRGPYDWLEASRESSKVVDEWISQQNQRTKDAILRGIDIEDTVLYKECLGVLASSDKIPFIGCEEGGYVYNYWQDDKNVRGLWRRTTLDEYRKPNTEWEDLLDIDAYNERMGQSWSGDSAWCWQAPLAPDYKSALIALSPTGNDKTHLFELDLVTKQFKTPMDMGGDGFSIRDEAKMRVVPYDQDTIYLSTPLPAHDEWGGVTESTYARVLKRWTRGEHAEYTSAETVLEIPRDFMWIDPEVDVWKYSGASIERRLVLIDARPSFYRHRIVHYDPSTREATRLALPDEIDEPYMSYFDYYVVKLRDARWGFPADALLVCYLEDLLEVSRALQARRVADGENYLVGECVMSDEDAQGLFHVLFAPTGSTSLDSATALKDFLVLNVMDHVRSKLVIWRCRSQTKRAGVPISAAFCPSDIETPWSDASLDVVSACSLHSDGSSNEMVVTSHGFLTPSRVELITLDGAASPLPALLKATPDKFDATGMSVTQHFATSRDGTKVPFFVVGKHLESPQKRPLLLYGYGAHGVVMTPQYNDWTEGNLWLSRGGLYAMANIRGGGEYGYKWHEAGAPNRLKAYEDFEAIAAHLIHELQLTVPEQLACLGGSMGGLLTANMLTRDTGLFKAVVCECPLADMERFTFLGMGHSWIPELGDPSTPEGWQAVQQYSPLHRITPVTERRFEYPKSLFVSSSNDDRTHPAHGRKMVAKMTELVDETTEAFLHEESEGGHGGNADIKQTARQLALIFHFLWRTLSVSPEPEHNFVPLNAE